MTMSSEHIRAQAPGGNRDARSMDRKILRAEALEALALSELRKSPLCKNATRVIIGRCCEVHPVTGACWAPTAVHPGTSGVEPCQLEVWHVCERLGRDYDLAGPPQKLSQWW